MPCAFVDERPFQFEDLNSRCQFVVPDANLIAVDGQSWCPYHFPMTNKNGEPTQKALWDNDKLEAFQQEILHRHVYALEQNSTLDLTGVVFPSKQNFSNITFPSVSFAKAMFSGGASFRGATFGGEAEFGEATFSRTTGFQEAIFSQNAGFDGVTFSGGVRFVKATFKGGAMFRRATFNTSITFEEADFNMTAAFEKATFSEAAEFNNTTFQGNARFKNATFRRGGLFGRSTFRRDARFERATFDGISWFESATFNGNAEFEGAVFSGPAEFENVRFCNSASFGASSPYAENDNPKASSFGLVNFSNATFGGEAKFENRQFLKSASFEACTFTKAPIFHSCRLPQGTTFPPRMNFKDVTSKDAVQAYRTLKLAMETVRARQEESMFYALEQQARRNQPDTPRSEQLISHLYEWTADFGESFVRPLGWLLLVTELFAFLYASMMTTYFPQGMSGYDGASLRFAIEQIVRPFGAWTSSSGTTMETVFLQPPGLPFSLKLLSTVQSLANVSFLGLSFFAVRRKFKLS